MNTTRDRRRGRARMAVLVLGTALALPGLGAASHLGCHTTGVGCPPFEPNLIADTTFHYVNTQSTVYYRTDQNDHETPIVDLEYLVPKGWQFAVDKVRPAAQADGVTPATDCTQIYSGGVPKLLGNAEAIASTVGVRTRVGAGRSLAEYGFTGANRPNIAFLRWDPAGGPDGVGQADLCMYLRTSGSVGGANEIIVPVALQRIDGDPSFEWRIDYDPMLFHWNAGLHGVNVSVVYTNFFFAALTSGNWNRNPTTGGLEGIVWSRTPATPGNYTFRAVLTGCQLGLNPPGSAEVCNGGVTLTRTLDDPIQIAHPPTSAIHDFARIRRVNGAPTLPGTGAPSSNATGLWGFSIVRSPNGDVPVEWEPPTLSPGDEVKGYALAVAYPGDFENIHWKYFITDSTDAGFAAASNEKVCGPAGELTTCTTTLAFGSMNAGSKVLKRNGTYSIALATIYTNGHRTDRGEDNQLMCDDGTGPGAPCDVSAPGFRSFRVNEPGISRWSMLLRDEPWLAFYTTTGRPGFSVIIINQVLLVDYAQKRAEFVFFNFEGTERVLPGSSSLIQSAGPPTGLVSFGSGQLGGNGERFLFAGVTRSGNATGRLIIYDMRGLPDCLMTVCGGMPSQQIINFSGSQAT